MEATVEKIGDIIILKPVQGRLDASTVKEFKDNVAASVDPKSKVVFDMSQLQFVDSTGLAAIVSFLKQSKAAGGDLKLCGLSQSVQKLFELVRLHKIVNIFNTKEEAINAFQT